MEGLWNQSREILVDLGDFSLCITAICKIMHIHCDTQTVPGFQIAVPPACLKLMKTKHSILHIDIHGKTSGISNYLPNKRFTQAEPTNISLLSK